jgi:hypothetical protein
MEKTVKYLYEFVFPDGVSRSFTVELDAATLDIKTPPRAAADCPDWTKLDFHKCPVCPLTAPKHPHCPAALASSEILEFFKDRISYEDVDVKITGSARGYFKKAKLQEAVGSLLGLLMASSGCPILEKLKPMAILHLPFAKSSETVYRVVSMYLMSQYFVMRKGGKPDWMLKNLSKIYAAVRAVNKAFSRRIMSVIEKDAGVNALVILDCFALAAAMSIDNEQIKKLEGLFEAYLREVASG